MPINKDNTPLDFYVGTADKIAKQNNKPGYVYLDTAENNVYVGTSGAPVAINGVSKTGSVVALHGTSMTLDDVQITKEELQDVIQMSKVNLENVAL